MAVTDLLVIIVAVILSRLLAIHFPNSFLNTTPGCRQIILLIHVSLNCSVWLTVAFTFDRFLTICYQGQNTKYCTEKVASVVIGTVCVLCCSINVPFYFVYGPLFILDSVGWSCDIRAIFYTSVAWRLFDTFDRIQTPCLPFLLILLFNVRTVRHIIVANRARRRLQFNRNKSNKCDTEMESRRKSIVLLFAISGSFLLLWLTYIVHFLLTQISGDSYLTGTNPNDPKYILQESGHMLQLLSSCTHTCIYAVTQTKFRGQFQDAFKYFSKLIMKCHK
ncbi:probable G-protein coupled receptor 139 [Stegostoma tigrinum]|uniref:probable G-protein coupled receptor 139 n=1 Tax=Stegostoma tigrinum TaxID=3053191 RepID=UPI00286FE815|nr:probable G-protein coupled receptor 139 [Stegostoma tigrinum]